LSDEACGSDHCITCSDEGVEMRVVARQPDGLAVCIDEGGSRTEVMTDLVAGVAPGDRVLVHAGVALTRLAEDPEDFGP
jgi:hydrogenase maturation factor